MRVAHIVQQNHVSQNLYEAVVASNQIVFVENLNAFLHAPFGKVKLLCHPVQTAQIGVQIGRQQRVVGVNLRQKSKRFL